MTYSMTAFATHKTHTEYGTFQWDLRSFNHRYLDLHFFLPPHFTSLEIDFRNIIQEKLHRGRVECQLNFEPAKSTSSFNINEGLLEQLILAHHHVDNRLAQTSPINTLELLRWPGLLHINEGNLETLFPSLLDTLQKTLIDLIQTRQREGGKLKNNLLSQLSMIKDILMKIKQRTPLLLEAQRHRLLKKIEDANLTLDPHRLEQEIIILTNKIDVTEEIDRLAIHIDETKRLFDTEGYHGRRLDFLMQEMNRETNTLGAKTNDSTIIHAAIEMKTLIEQMREQIQNIE